MALVHRLHKNTTTVSRFLNIPSKCHLKTTIILSSTLLYRDTDLVPVCQGAQNILFESYNGNPPVEHTWRYYNNARYYFLNEYLLCKQRMFVFLFQAKGSRWNRSGETDPSRDARRHVSRGRGHAAGRDGGRERVRDHIWRKIKNHHLIPSTLILHPLSPPLFFRVRGSSRETVDRRRKQATLL